MMDYQSLFYGKPPFQLFSFPEILVFHCPTTPSRLLLAVEIILGQITYPDFGCGKYGCRRYQASAQSVGVSYSFHFCQSS